VVPKRISETGSGVGLKRGEELAEPSAKRESSKECDPGVSPNKRVSEPESKLLQSEKQVASFAVRKWLSSFTENSTSENSDSSWPPTGIVDELKFRVWERINGNVTVVAFRLTKVASLVALALEFAKEEPGPLAKPARTAVTPPGGDNDAAPVARALPLKNWGADALPDKKEILVPDGIGPGVESEASTKSL
jgi:hypothetical protein